MNLEPYRYSTIEELQRYLELLVRDLVSGLGPTGFTVTTASTAQINTLTNMTAQAILPVGTVFFDTTKSKLVVLVTSAVPGVSNGVIETVTSV